MRAMVRTPIDDVSVLWLRRGALEDLIAFGPRFAGTFSA
jgi:hypothetical protein